MNDMVKKLEIEATPKTPMVDFDPESGVLKLEGRSIPENAFQFYEPILQWLDEYVNNAPPSTELVFKLDYFNTSSSKALLSMFRKLEKLLEAGKQVKIKWYYEEGDEDMKEAGIGYSNLVKVPIELVEVPEL